LTDLARQRVSHQPLLVSGGSGRHSADSSLATMQTNALKPGSLYGSLEAGLEEVKEIKESESLKSCHALSKNPRLYLEAGLREGGAAAHASRNEEKKRGERAPLEEGSWWT
jgi:hypothetical protein